MVAASRTQPLLCSANNPDETSKYLKDLLDHGAWGAPLSVGIVIFIRGTDCFIDLTCRDKASPSGARDKVDPSGAVKEENLEQVEYD
jgi:hypothetical protein